jgi:hypothetical protein
MNAVQIDGLCVLQMKDLNYCLKMPPSQLGNLQDIIVSRIYFRSSPFIPGWYFTASWAVSRSTRGMNAQP